MAAAKKPAAKKAPAKKPAADTAAAEPHKVVPPSTAPAHVEPEVDPALAEQIAGDAGESADALEAGFLGSPTLLEP